jgi:hypothetical protein
VEIGDPCGEFQIPSYGEPTPLPTARPDVTADAGEVVTSSAYLYSPLYSDEDVEAGVGPDLNIPREVSRIADIVHFAWKGGDPGVDLPLVTLQVQGEDGEFTDVLTPSGRPVTSGPDILLTTTPDPLYPAEDAQSWTWLATWQVLGHDGARVDLPEGVYRLHVEGHEFVDDGATTWPWSTAEYSVDSDEFAVVPGRIALAAAGDDILAHYRAPDRGYRLITMDGQVRGTNPIAGDTATLTLTYGDGSVSESVVTGSHGGGYTSFGGVLVGDVVYVEVTDAWGNVGKLDLSGGG